MQLRIDHEDVGEIVEVDETQPFTAAEQLVTCAEQRALPALDVGDALGLTSHRVEGLSRDAGYGTFPLV